MTRFGSRAESRHQQDPKAEAGQFLARRLFISITPPQEVENLGEDRQIAVGGPDLPGLLLTRPSR